MGHQLITVYTAIAGYYDYLRPQVTDENCEFFCFADSFQPQVAPWKIQPLPNVLESGALNSRVPKLLPHFYFDSEFTIWQDGTKVLTRPPTEVINQLGDCDLALLRHPCRDCVYQEAEVCLREGIGNPDEIRRMVAAYREEGYPEHAGLWYGGVIVRRNNALQDFNEAWFREFRRFRTNRDQFSLAHTIKTLGIQVRELPGQHTNNKFWKYHFHAAFRERSGNPELASWHQVMSSRQKRLEEFCA